MRLRLLRHATLLLEYHALSLLVDPMLSALGAMDPVPMAADTRRIPLVDLPIDGAQLQALLHAVDGVIVTHLHRDHWDAAAVALLPKTLPIFCQPPDAQTLRDQGFAAVTPVADGVSWRGIAFQRTGGQHGTGAIGRRMGPVSGFVLRAPDEPVLYVAGDTIWCQEVVDALQTHRPAVIVVNAGAAQFLTGDPITMTAADVASVARAAPDAQIVAVHMETINHCGLTRPALHAALAAEGCAANVAIPDDGAWIDPTIRAA